LGIPYNKYIQFLRSSKKKRRQLACFVTALSVFVSGGVFWQLRGIGTAMVDENLPNADDSGEAITVTPLNASELETQDVWEATLPPLTDIAGENLARIAESQLGYSESSVNFVHAEDGETHNGYTRYGAWYGNPYGEWNTMFTYFCLNYAGVSSDDIPYGSGCWAWSLELDKAGLVVPVTRGSPARGDILLIDSDLDGKADRSCIVQSVSDDEISAVEGDIDGSVALTSYLIGDEQLLGMVSLADIVPEPTVLPDEPAEVDFSAESESGITVEAHADRGAFPPDTEMFVFDISQDEAVQAAADHFGDEAPDDIQAVAVDITFRSPDGEELEPAQDSQVRVSIVLPEEQSLSGGDFSLLHISDEGDVQEVADADVSADSADFVAESFSVYVLTSNSTPSDTELNIVNLSQISAGSAGSSSDNPLTITVGQHITVFSDVNATGNGFTIRNNDNDNDKKNTLIRDSKNPNNVDTQQGQYAYYVGNDSDSAIIQFDGTAMVYVKVIEPQIYVKTDLDERHEDRIHEYLAEFHGTLSEDYLIFDNNHVPLYLKNRDGYSDRYAYCIPQNGRIEVISYIPANSGLRFVPNSNVNNVVFNEIEQICEPVASSDPNGLQRLHAIYEVSASNDSVNPNDANTFKKSYIQFGDEKFYVLVVPNERQLSHADIEIADGGTYTETKTSIDKNGNIIITTTEFKAYVSEVNSCNIYNSDGSPTKIVSGANKGTDLIFEHDDYYKHGTLGTTQFELTSNYVTDKSKSDGGWSTTKGTDTVWLRNNKNFYIGDAYEAVFDVKLELHPVSQIVETRNSNGDVISTVPTDSSALKNDYKDHLKFKMNRQSIIDAYNKCPAHTGLDFTLAANAAMLNFDIKKDFVGGDFTEDSFDFQLYGPNDSNKLYSSVSTSETGIISFKDLYFDEEGDYTFVIKEVVGSNPSVIYDNEPHTITVHVNRIGEYLTAIVSVTELSKRFTNYQTYTLPATGGTGELPYILFGSAMLSGAFILLFIRRKKAAAR